MKDRSRVLVYPYSVEFTPILRHRGLLKDYEITGLVSPAGFALGGQDAGYADNGSSIGMIVEDSIAKQLDSFDTFMVVDSYPRLDFKKVIRPKIDIAIDAGKDIICLAGIEKGMSDEIEKACKLRGVSYKNICNSWNSGQYGSMEVEKLVEITTPVIFVAGLSERTNKFEIQLALRERLLEKGYALSQIGTRPYSSLLGIHPFPEFMYSSSISESNKVVLFNLFVKEMEVREKPDVIVIGIPGGLMPFNHQFTNRFGILAYEICQAVSSDAAIISVLYENVDAGFFDMISTSMKYKLGFQPDCFNVANVQLDWAGSKESDYLKYIHLNSEFVDEKKKKFQTASISVFNVLNTADADGMTEFLLDKLSPYGDTAVI